LRTTIIHLESFASGLAALGHSRNRNSSLVNKHDLRLSANVLYIHEGCNAHCELRLMVGIIHMLTKQVHGFDAVA
jgi:hypothetical protein